LLVDFGSCRQTNGFKTKVQRIVLMNLRASQYEKDTLQNKRFFLFEKNVLSLKSNFFIMGKNQENTVTPNSINIIGSTTNIVGDIVSESDIRIDGNIKGTIQTKGRVVVGQSGIIIGKIICQNAEISGNVEGKINVSELLSLKSTSNINGEINTGKLAIEPSAIFTGTCKMGEFSMSHDEE